MTMVNIFIFSCSYMVRGDGPGKPGTKKGEKCRPRGNALIILEVNHQPDIPDDNANGGTSTLEFPDAGSKYFYKVGLLDLDEAATVVVIYENGKGALPKRLSLFRIWAISLSR